MDKTSKQFWSQNIFTYYISISCNHCNELVYVESCPIGAMMKRKEDVLVVVDKTACVGCRYCEMRCLYGAPQFDTKKYIMTKCDGYHERITNNILPICVKTHPQRAIDFGEINELRKKYENENAIVPLTKIDLTKPNLALKAYHNAKTNSDKTGKILNIAEV